MCLSITTMRLICISPSAFTPSLAQLYLLFFLLFVPLLINDQSTAEGRSSAGTARLLKKPGCTVADLNRVDLTTARLLTAGPHGRPVPENFEQLKPFCAETKNLTAKLESFIGRCYSKEIGRFARIALYSVKKSVNTFCGAGGRKSKKLQQFLTKANPCINKHLRHNDSCIVRFIEDMEATFEVEDKLKIPYLCCHTLASLQCLENELDRHKCSRQNHELIMEFVRTNTDDFFAIGCADYSDSSDKCKSLKPLPKLSTNSSLATTGKPRKQKNVKSSRSYKTPVFIMIDLVSSIGNGGGGFGRKAK